ncbi:YARHG domain-containing protein [Microcoleus sp. FACHB-1515]|uniref:protein kinase domain-containing protein n=1 Tax=Cyanophyceae TaxID=3028117 RepID=UPI0016821363|nr:YARHG domain-containing protein [Microcoleus sp. FACHB-1515]MBD2089972.1 YARHG domain-containing protein [Microcoleus sp. FACHB-1515]
MQALLNHRYRVLEVLGSGGFGDTFLAEDTQMPSRRRCVVKQLRSLAHQPQYQLVQERFQREAAILEELGDRCDQIPRLYAYTIEDGQFYLVQEWIEGHTLSELVQHNPLDEQTVRSLLVELLPVLNFIHGQGIIHRDIKPDNVIVRSDGKPVLIDFGAVKETLSTTLINSQGQPVSSIAIGTPGYMPPEQAAGRPVYSSDLYSLALTAIYLLSGESPQNFSSNPDSGEIEWQHFVHSIDPHFARVLNRAVQLHPRDRYPTAQAMLADLQAETTVIAAPVAIKFDLLATPQRVWIGGVGLMIALMVAAGAIVRVWPQQSTEPASIASGIQRSSIEPTASPTPIDYDWLSERLVTQADMQGKSAEDLTRMRNAIFARHGRRFDDVQLQRYFDSQPWYRPVYDPIEFPTDLLNSIERENATRILNYQKQNGLM